MRKPLEQSMEEHFWSRVWRCTHTHPCKRCCWSWLSPTGLYSRLDHAPPPFNDPRLPYKRMPVSRVAYLLHKETLAFPALQFQLCHSCDYKPCANYSHLHMGSMSDNRHDHWLPNRGPHAIITLPDGRQFPPGHGSLEGPRGNPYQHNSRFHRSIFVLYQNDYEGPRGYALTDGIICQIKPCISVPFDVHTQQILEA